MEAIGAISSILTVVSSVTNLAKQLNDIRESYNNVALNTTMVASRLSLIRAALTALHEWRSNDQQKTEHSKQLDKDLEVSLSCCAILITVLEGKLGEAGYMPGMKQKIRYVWLEDKLKEYLSNLDGQVQALDLLLTIYQCKTATEQRQTLERVESRRIIETVRAETQTLRTVDKDFNDAASVLSRDPSVHFDFDSILMQTPAYINVYGDRPAPTTPPVPDRALKPPRIPPRPPQPRNRKRKEVWNPYLGQVVDVGTISKEDSGGLQAATAEQAVGIGTSPGEGPVRSEGLLVEKIDVPATVDDSIFNEYHRHEPTITEASSGDRNTVRGLPDATGIDPSQEDSGGPKEPPDAQIDTQTSGDDATIKQSWEDGPTSEEHFSSFEKPARDPPMSLEKAVEDSVSSQWGHDAETANGSSNCGAETAQGDLTSAEVNTTDRGEVNVMRANHCFEPATAKAPIGVNRGCPTPAGVKLTEKVLANITPSATEGLKNPMNLAFDDKDGSGETQDIPGGVNGPTRIIQRKVTRRKPVPSRGTQKDRLSATILLPPARKEHDSEPKSEPEGFKTLSSKIKDAGSGDQHFTVTSGVSIGNFAPNKDSKDTRPPSSTTDNSNGTTKSASLNTIDKVAPVSQAGDSQNTSHDPPATENAEKDETEQRSDPPIDASAPRKHSYPDMNHSATELGDDHKTRSNSASILILKQPTESTRRTQVDTHWSSLGIDINFAPEILGTEAEPLSPNAPVPCTVLPQHSGPPQRPPPIPSVPASYSSPSSKPPPTPTTASTGSDLFSVASQSDSSILGTSSTASSSEFPEVNTATSIQYSTSNSVATSQGLAAPLSLRQEGQLQLRNLQTEHAAAKARGDTKTQADTIQKSVEVIWRTQLARPPEPKVMTPSPKLKSRHSMMRFPSLTSSTKAETLGHAAATGNEPALTKLLDDNINVNSTSCGFKTPLMRAASSGHVRCMQILKTFGADEFAVDKTGATALHHAVLANQILAVEWFLATFPPPCLDPVRRLSSILLRATDAAKWGHSQKNLREACDAEGCHPLHIAIANDMGGMVKTLLAAGVDIEAKNTRGRTPLHLAVMAQRSDTFDTLLRSGAKVEATDVGGLTALHWAAKMGNVAMIETLLENGANRWEYDNAGYNPIHQAAGEGHISAIEALLTEAIDLDKRSKYGETSLHIASLFNHLDLARYLLKNGVDVNAWAQRSSSWNGMPRAKLIGSALTPLHFACCLGHFEMAALLLDHEAFVNAPALLDGYTPLMMAVEAENTDLVSLLHRRGAKVNASLPGTLTTALHIASRKGDLETVRELCRAGANSKARAGKESYKRTPAEESLECPDKEKRKAVVHYFDIIRLNELVRRQSQIVPMEQRVTYAPRGQGQAQQGGYLINPGQSALDFQGPAPPPYSKAPPSYR